MLIIESLSLSLLMPLKNSRAGGGNGSRFDIVGSASLNRSGFLMCADSCEFLGVRKYYLATKDWTKRGCEFISVRPDGQLLLHKRGRIGRNE